MKIVSWLRLSKILLLGYHYGLDTLTYQIPYLRRLRFLFFLNPFYWFSANRHKSIGERVTLFLEALGPIYVKFGQIISTRPDIFPKEVIDCVSRLRDQVKPFSLKDWVSIEGITSIDKTPIASASIAQVHRMVDDTNQQRLIKIVRPNIERQVKQDIAMMKDIIQIINTLNPAITQFHLMEILIELERVIYHEMDMHKEAYTISLFHKTRDANLIIPKVYPRYTTKSTLVMDELKGIAINDIDAIEKAGIDRKKLAVLVLDTFFDQIFNNEVFHADLHPGNVFVNINKHGEYKIILLDFGIVGRLSKYDRMYIIKNITAMIEQDYEKMVALHLESQWLPQDVDSQSFVIDMQNIATMVLSKKLHDISLGKLLLLVFSTAKRHKINIQSQLILLQKTVLGLEGIVRTLDPHLDLWKYSKPKLKSWIKKHNSVRNTVSRITTALKAVEDFFTKPNNGHSYINQQLQEIKRDHKKMINRLVMYQSVLLIIVLSLLLVAGVIEIPW